MILLSDDKDSRRSKKVLAELENIDDECDSRGVYFVKIDNYEEAKEYGIEIIPTLVYFESEIPYIFEGECCSSISAETYDSIISRLSYNPWLIL